MSLIQAYDGRLFHELEICGLRRTLPIRQVDEGVWIASNHVVIFGDIELIKTTSKELTSRLSQHNIDILVTAEAKAEALSFEITSSLGLPYFIVCRKGIKSYMKNPLMTELKSITTKEPQKLVLDETDIEKIRGKNVAIVDDVVTTGGNMNAMERLVLKAGGNIRIKACIWVEGLPTDEAAYHARRNLVYLGYLPIFYSVEKYEETLKRYKQLMRSKNETYNL